MLIRVGLITNCFVTQYYFIQTDEQISIINSSISILIIIIK